MVDVHDDQSGPMTLLLLAILGLLSVRIRARHRVRAAARQRELDIERALPDVVDLLRLGAHAGLTPHQLLPVVIDVLPTAIGPAFVEVQRRVQLGVRLGDALDALDPLGEVAHPLVAAMRSAAFDGTPLLPALERVATDARLLRRRRAEHDARRLPVQLLLPLVLCVLPAFVLLAVVPLIAASIGSLSL